MSYDFPFKCENNEIKYLTFELANLNFHKHLEHAVSKKDPEIPLYFSGKMNLNAKINEFILFKTDDISANINLFFYNEKLGEKIDSDVDLGTYQIFISKEYLKIISYVLKSITKLSIAQSDVISKAPPPPVLIVGRSKFNFKVKLNAIDIFLTDGFKENELKITIVDLNGSVNYYLSSFKYSLVLKNVKIQQFNKAFVQIHNQIEFNLEKQTDSDPLIVDASILNPHVFLEFKSIFWLVDFMGHFQTIIPMDEAGIVNEQIEEVKEEDSIPLSVIKPVKSLESIVGTEKRIKLKKDYTPSSMIFSNLLLTQSIDEFLQGSTSYVYFLLLDFNEK